MEAKKKIIERIVMSRRILVTSKLTEETKLCSVVLMDLQKKHLQLLKQLHILQTLKISLSSERLIWKMERTQSFWDTDCQLADECLFKNNFRMSRRLFYKLCELLPGLRKKDTKIREAIPLEKRVAIALYALGSSAEYCTIANKFGVEKATVCKILLNFCTEVWRVLAPIYLNNFPLTKEKVEGLVQEFEILGFPQCMGALDGCHIEIHPSNEDATDYYNYKGWYSIVLLALVDARCRFIYVNCGSPGCCNDSQIFQGSSLKQHLDQCSLLTDLKKNISGVDVPVFIIGDSAFRLSDKLMKPYPSRVLQNHQQKRFNYALSKSSRVVKNAFGHLKARFRRIAKGIDNATKNANAIVLSCCVLHNFLNDNNDEIDEKWLHALQSVEPNRSYPEHKVLLTDQSNYPERIRNAISTHLSVADAAGDGVSAGTAGNDESYTVHGDVSSEDTCMYGEDTVMKDDGIGEAGDNGWFIIDEFMS